MYNKSYRRSGVTLIEMLVVVSIMMFMLGIAAPMFRLDQDDTVAEDTARALNAYIQEARAKAMATGRPCGVALIPFDNYPSASVLSQLVESPPLYTGDAYDSTVTVSGNGATPTLSFKNASADWTKAGNLIRFGGRGVWYEMTSATSCKLQQGDSSDSTFRPWSRKNWTTSYEILSPPVSQAKNYLQSIGMAEPLKVVRGSAIDLYYSKVGDTMFKNSAKKPIVIMFNPTGEVGVCYNLGGGRGTSTSTSIPSTTISILCGQWDRALSTFTPEDGKHNNEVYDSFWIKINPSTGISEVVQNEP